MLKRFVAISICIVILLTGCSVNIKKLFKDDEVHFSSLTPESLVFDGHDILEQSIKLITTAQKAIFIEQSLFNNKDLFNLILKKAAEGVEVRILLNQSSSNREILEKFKSKNISAHFYPARKGQSNNVKLLIVDYNNAIIYGSNWTNEGFDSHTLAVKLNGKAARTATTVFNRDWIFTTTLSLDIPEANNYSEDYITLATNTNVKQQLLSNIATSKSSIYIQIQEISDTDIINSLIEAKNRSVDVKIIIDAVTQQMRPTPITLSRLTEANIDVRFYKQNSSLKRNFGIFDSESFILSSSGWTYNAFVLNHEFSITVPSPKASATLNNNFYEDWEKASISLD